MFLANTDPKIQASVLDQLTDPKLVVMDTMNLWIDIARKPLMAVMKRVDGIVINDQEARDLRVVEGIEAKRQRHREDERIDRQRHQND